MKAGQVGVILRVDSARELCVGLVSQVDNHTFDLCHSQICQTCQHAHCKRNGAGNLIHKQVSGAENERGVEQSQWCTHKVVKFDNIPTLGGIVPLI